MLLKILKMILYFFVIFAKPVYADNFDSTLDTAYNRYFQTVALGVSGYPNIPNIQYESGDFAATDTQSILSWDMGVLMDMGDSPRRISMVADHIDAPPGTQVDVVYLYRNYTEYEVEIPEIDWVLSRNLKENGSLTEVLDIPEYMEGNFEFKYSFQNLIKSGMYKRYSGPGYLPRWDSGSYILDSVTIKNPLTITDVQAIRNKNNGVDFKINIQNTSNEDLNNLKFTYGSYEEILNILPMQKYGLNFSMESVPEELGTFSIYNPNIKEACAIYGAPSYSSLQTDAIPVLAYRGWHIVPGASVQPEGESFCIKRIPYTMTSEPMVFTQINLTETENTESTKESEINAPEKEIEEVLGTSDIVLPKTGKGTLSLLGLLVVDVLLWYSVYILRRSYEGKNTNSRIRTKSK